MKKKLPIYIHAALWIVYTILIALVINKTFSQTDTLIRTSVIVLIQMGLFYFNSFILFPRLIKSKKVWKYLLQISIIIIAISIFYLWFEKLFHPEFINDFAQERINRMRGRPPKMLSLRGLANARFLFNILSILIILILSSAYSAAQISLKKEFIEVKASQANLESEMKFLKSQINPHFLFNALNNIYSLTLSGSNQSSEMILKLSYMLRYILYECNGPFVTIEKEWEYILNYIDFQKLKSKDDINLNLEYTNEISGSLISPMIFIPFIENAFKHSHVDSLAEAWLNISLNNKKEEIIFQVDNSVPSKKHNKDELGGVGLENVKRRLELIYSDNHDLIINDKKNSYSIILRIRKIEKN